jgi:hypothetical protein
MIAEVVAAAAVTTVVVAAVAVTIVAAAVVASAEEEDNQSINGILKRGNHVTAEKNEIQKNAKGPRERHGHTRALDSLRIFCFESLGRRLDHSPSA